MVCTMRSIRYKTISATTNIVTICFIYPSALIGRSLVGAKVGRYQTDPLTRSVWLIDCLDGANIRK